MRPHTKFGGFMPHFPHFNCDQILRPPRGFREAVTVTRFPGKLCGCFASSDRRSPFLGIQTDRRRGVGEAFGIAWLPIGLLGEASAKVGGGRAA